MTQPEAPPPTEPAPSAEAPPPVEPEAPSPVEPAPLTPRAITLAAATVGTSLLVAAGLVLPVPYAITGPGPTRDTLGHADGSPLISIEGAPVHESTGELLLTTASIVGGPGYPVAVPDMMRGWWDRTRAVAPVEQHFPLSQTREETTERNQEQMISSQETATVAALEELGFDVPTVLEITGTLEETGAVGVAEPGDVVLAVNGRAVKNFAELSAALDGVTAPDAVVLTVDRAGERRDLEIVTTDDGTGRALLGVEIDPEFDIPLDVEIQIERIGGSSAGTMFALGIIDKLTDADEANGAVIAGTGTIDLTGAVGPIGAIRQKLVGAVRADARWFLAPEANCDEVVGYVPDGLRVVSVSTLRDARAAVEAIGAGDGESLPTCG